MKYTNEIEINLPLKKVIEQFDNPDKMMKWQPGFISFEPLSGTPGLPGAFKKQSQKFLDPFETFAESNN